MGSCRSQHTDKEHKQNVRSLLFLGLCSMVLLGAFCGCRRKAPQQPVKEPNAAKVPSDVTPKEAATPSADEVVVTINGTKITRSQLEQRVEREFKPYAARAAKMPSAFAEQVRSQIRANVVEYLVIEHLLGEKVKEAKIEVTDNDLAERINKIASSQDPPLSVDDLKGRMEAQGGNFEEFKQRMRQGVAYEKLVQPQWDKMPAVTEAEARKYYDDNTAEFDVAEQVRASHILISPDAAAADPNAANAKARAKAEELLKKVKEGADFAEVAKANSSCPSAPKGGDLGFFARGAMVAPFEQAAFALKPGEVSDVVETNFGYHIIKVTERKDAAKTPFEQAKENITEQLTQQKRTVLYQDYVESLKSKASVVYGPGWGPKPQPPAPLGGAAAPR